MRSLCFNIVTVLGRTCTETLKNSKAMARELPIEGLLNQTLFFKFFLEK
jgi:hypothetical protein